MANMVGLDTVMKNLNAAIKKIEGACMAGLWDAGLQIQRVSQERTPVDTGNLKGSHYTRKGTKPNTVEIGATAAYAIYVHENMEARHNPPGRSKFLESAITDNQDKILEIIRRRAVIP